MDDTAFDVGIIGGGPAGLSFGILMAKEGFSVAVLERHSYPHHKVCGEYLSNESLPFLQRLGVDVNAMALPSIDQLVVTSPFGFTLRSRLDLGATGISRYKLDHALAVSAERAGVRLLTGCSVTDATRGEIRTNQGSFRVKMVVGAFGKSNPRFAADGQSVATNYVGVKYHIRGNAAPNVIALHHFHGGYCGTSRVEDDRQCLCYMIDSRQFGRRGKSIPDLERRVLSQNPWIGRLLGESEYISTVPVTTSNIRYSARRAADHRMLYLGDAAGCIPPLTGNGMSMAFRTAWMLAPLAARFLRGVAGYEAVASEYTKEWIHAYQARIIRGRLLQRLLSSPLRCDVTLRALAPFGGVKRAIVAATHGEVF